MIAQRIDLASRSSARVARGLGLALVVASAALAGAADAGGPALATSGAKAASPRRVLDPKTFVKVAPTVADRLGTHLSGVVQFPPLAEGTPLGSATEACGALTAKASHRSSPGEARPGMLVVGGPLPIVEDAKVVAAPIDAADIAKGCRFELANLPKGKEVFVEVVYDTSRGWAPSCGGDKATSIEGDAVALSTPPADAVSVKATFEVHRKCLAPAR